MGHVLYIYTHIYIYVIICRERYSNKHGQRLQQLYCPNRDVFLNQWQQSTGQKNGRESTRQYHNRHATWSRLEWSSVHMSYMCFGPLVVKKNHLKKKNKNAEVSISTTLNFHHIETMKLCPVDDLWWFSYPAHIFMWVCLKIVYPIEPNG